MLYGKKQNILIKIKKKREYIREHKSHMKKKNKNYAKWQAKPNRWLKKSELINVGVEMGGLIWNHQRLIIY